MDLIKMLKSFIPAWIGIREHIHIGNNFKIHLIAAVAAIALSLFFCISATEWCIILLCIAMVLAAESFNTCIELLVDQMTQEKKNWAKRIKDISASAVLLLAIVAFICGCIIWLPYCKSFIQYYPN